MNQANPLRSRRLSLWAGGLPTSFACRSPAMRFDISKAWLWHLLGLTSCALLAFCHMVSEQTQSVLFGQSCGFKPGSWMLHAQMCPSRHSFQVQCPLASCRAGSIEWFAEQGRRVDGDVLQTVSPNARMVVLKQPVGVCASITPWNFPVSGPALF